jgi:hypothetical protein
MSQEPWPSPGITKCSDSSPGNHYWGKMLRHQAPSFPSWSSALSSVEAVCAAWIDWRSPGIYLEMLN